MVTLDCITKTGSFTTCDGKDYITKAGSFMTCDGNYNTSCNCVVKLDIFTRCYNWHPISCTTSVCNIMYSIPYCNISKLLLLTFN